MYNFIINPNSRGGIGGEIWKKLKTLLNKKNTPYREFITNGEKSGENIANNLSKDINSPTNIIVLGGDGTLNEVINGLKNIPLITLGVIPIGSGNDFVRSFGAKKTYEEYLDSILSPRTITEYNIGSVETEYFSRKFIVSSGIGFDASITYAVNYSKFKKRFKNTPLIKLIYVFSTIGVLIKYKPLEYKVYEKNSTKNFSNGYFCVVMNTAYEGKAVKFCPDAKGNDNILDFCLINSKSKLKIVFLILRAYLGKHISSKDVYISKGNYFKVESSPSTHCHTDGEQIGESDWAKYLLTDEKIKVIVN